jgi:hypothetical protein
VDQGGQVLLGQVGPGVEISQDCLRLEVEDAGGPWRGGVGDDGRPHGFDVVTAIAGPENWNIDGDSPDALPGPGSAGEVRMTVLPSPRVLGRSAGVVSGLAADPAGGLST